MIEERHLDPNDLGFFGPDSVTWRIHGDPAGLIGGLRALLIQALNPLAMAAVAQYSDFRQDPWGRLQRTSDYLMVTTFGDSAAAAAAGARVRALHRRVRGVDEITGRPYRADDPELLLWVHAVEVHSFLTAYRRYAGAVSDADANRYVMEMVTAAELVGLSRSDVPHDLSELRAYLRGVTDLHMTPAAKEGMRLVLSPPMPLPARPLWGVPAAAAISLLPRHIRKMYGIPWLPPVDPLIRAYVFSLTRSLNLMLPGPPILREARARARRFVPFEEASGEPDQIAPASTHG
jgi:uncharacterized protein (DUF2236 family)